MLLSQYKYLYLGLIDMNSENAVIIDPYINDISILSEKILPSSFRSQRISRVKKGSYICYSLLNPDGSAKYLLALHSAYDIRDFEKMEFELFGAVSVSFAHAVCVSDEDSMYRTSDYGPGLPLYDDAMFSIAHLTKMLYSDTLDCDDLCRNRLDSLVGGSVSGYISGADIKKTFANDCLWDGFYSFDEASTLWSCEILHRLHTSNTGAVIAPGCVAAVSHPTMSDLARCYVYKTPKHHTTGILVELL